MSNAYVVCMLHQFFLKNCVLCFVGIMEQKDFERLSRVRMVPQLWEPIFQPLKDRLEWLDSKERRLVMPNSLLIWEKGRPKFMRICNEMDEQNRELPTSLWIENELKLRCGLCHQKGYNRCTCRTWNVESTSRGAT